MEFLNQNIQRITELIHSKVDYNVFNSGYTIVYNDDHVLLKQNDKTLKQVGCHSLLVPRYLLFFKFKHLTCLSCLREYQNRFYDKMFSFLFCTQSCHLNEIYTYQVNKKKTSKLFR